MDKIKDIKESLGFNRSYFMAFMIVFTIEVLIALYVRDRFIRPYVGDALVIVLMYLFIKSFYMKPTKRLAYYLFAFACLIEVLQLVQVNKILGLSNNPVIMVVLGSTFDIMDIISYACGMGLLIIWEKILRRNIAYL